MLKTYYNILFHFENEHIEIIEIKRSDIISDDKSKIYFWLLYNKTNNALTPLTFVSMKSDNDFEFREFQSGTLKFNENSVLFEYENTSYHLQNTDKKISLSEHLKSSIDDHLLNQN